MMWTRQDPTQRASDTAAFTLTAALAFVLFVTKPAFRLEPARMSPGEPSIAISLQSGREETPPAAPVRPTPPPTPRKEKQRLIVRQSAVAAVPDAAAAPPESEPAPAGGALIAASSAPAGGADVHLDLEAQYAAALRADIDRRTHPPDSAQYRLHRPSGEVRVRFVLSRSGEARGVTALRSSGSSVLDEAAASIVASGHYLPMPAKAFVGESEHVFAVTIEFRAPSSSVRGQ
jgi:periplasmic protein TonB